MRRATLHAALLVAFAATARAQEIGPAPGNVLNPAGINPTTAGRWMDDDGLGTRIPAARTPTGKLYNIPLDPDGEPAMKDQPGWFSKEFIEFGGTVNAGNRSAGVPGYLDFRSSFYLNAYAVAAEKPSEARYFEMVGGAVGMDDQFHHLQFGRYNDWKVTAWFDGSPMTLTGNYRSLWGGLGTGNLGLLTLKPGGGTSAAATQTSIQNALAATTPQDLEIVRRRAGVRLDTRLSETWRAYASFTDDKRDGSRPFGAVFGGGGGGGDIEIPQPIDYETHDFVAGVQYTGERDSFNLRASASFFHNRLDTLAVQNPLFITTNGSTGLAPNVFTQARFDLPPDNKAFNVKGEYARAFPDFYRGNLTATLALGTMRQDDNLIAPTDYPLTGGAVTAGGVSLANAWNTTAALSRQSAETRLDTRLADVSFAARPADALDVKAKVRYYQTVNRSDEYFACNPLTGQWGRVLNDGSGLSIAGPSTVAGSNPAGTSANAYNAAACNLSAVLAMHLAPAVGNIPIATVPADYKQLVGNVTADYRLGRASSVNGSVERETFHRSYRERDETWEDKIKVGYVDRGTLEGTLRVSYEYDRRGGSDYVLNPYLPFTSGSFGPAPAANTVAMSSFFKTIDTFRSFDLADRTQNVLNGRIDYVVMQDLDTALSAQAKDATYPSAYGRVGKQRANSVTLDMNYQAGSNAVMYGFYTHQWANMDQRGVQANSCVVGNTYYFFSDGRIANAVTGATPPATPAGTTLVATQAVTAANWIDICGSATPTSPLFPESRAWQVGSKDTNDVFGFGIRYDLGKAKFDASYTRTLGRTQIAYTYNANALGLSALQASLAGSGLSDLTFAQNIFNASLYFPLDKNVNVRLLVRHESGKLRDWHYDGVGANPMPANNTAFLDAGPIDYRDTLYGVFFQVRTP